MRYLFFLLPFFTLVAKEPPITEDAAPKKDFFASLDFIYWKVSEEGVSFAYDGTVVGVPLPENVQNQGKLEQIPFRWNPGFKVALGAYLPYDGWDILSRYTFITSHPGKRTKTLALNQALTSPLRALWNAGQFQNLPDEEFSQASGKWNMTLHLVDLELGRAYFISPSFTLRPFIGLKGARQFQSLETSYHSLPEMGITEIFSMDQNLSIAALGIRIGSENQWLINSRFSIYANFSLSALWERNHLREKDLYQPDSLLPPTYTNLDLCETHFSLQGLFELALGLCYDFSLPSCSATFRLFGGWESQIWLDQNKFFHLNEKTSHGDLSLYGPSLRLLISF